jgi:serine/threonine-protein kinase
MGLTTLAGIKLGRYEVLKCLARGATTDLLLARARGMAGFERHVVIKRIQNEHAEDPVFVQAFMTEARLAAALHHHNIVQVQDIGEDGGAPYFAMEYIHGEDVRTILAHLNKRRERLPLEYVISIVTSVAAALHHAHERSTPDGKPLSIVHRDVTPANILVSYDGNVKVVDFGIAKAAITMTTQVGVLKGRSPYMAPEQCAAKPVDRRSDVFALGIVLWEMATMRRLFKGATDHEIMSTIVTGVVPKPSSVAPDLPPAIEAIIMRALEKAPGDRYASAAELGNALEQLAKTAGLSASTSTLATYLVQHVGPRQEPWLVAGEQLQRVPIDFDNEEATDVSTIPTEAEPKAGKPKLPAPKLAGTREKLVPAPPILPLPVTVRASEIPTVTASIVISDEDVGAPVDPSVEPEERARTSVATPPKPPPRVARKSDLTVVVRRRSSGDTDAVAGPRKRLVIGAIGAGAIGLAIVVIVIATSADSKLAAARSGPATAPAPRPIEAHTPAPVEPPTPVEVATPTPVEAPAPTPVAAPTPTEIARAPSLKKPVPKKPIAKKPIAKPKYDPNSLFLKTK